MKTVEEAIKFRRSMPEFNTEKKVSDQDLTTILNAGRLAPSGLGSEPTRVLVVRDKEIKQKIAKKAYNKMNWKKVETADTLIIFVSLKGDIFKSKEFVSNRIERWGITNKVSKALRIKGYLHYLNKLDCDTYSANQAYIAMSYMSIQTAALDIESVIMQGFSFNRLNIFLHENGYIDKDREVAYISMAIGYTNKEIRSRIHPQVRLTLDEYCQYI